MSRMYDHATSVMRWMFDLGISTPPILDADWYFPEASRFVMQWRSIRDEALQVAQQLGAVPRFHEIVPDQEPISANDGRDWRMFIMKAYGVEFRDRIQKCPKLHALVAAAPCVLSASFSILGAQKHIPMHRGPFKGILRFTLMLVAPQDSRGQPANALKVEESVFRLREGEFLLWDDTRFHEAWNESDEIRIALVLDVWRRHMPLPLRLLSQSVVLLVRSVMLWRGTMR